VVWGLNSGQAGTLNCLNEPLYQLKFVICLLTLFFGSGTWFLPWFLLFFETGFHYTAQVSLELMSLQSIGIIGVYHHNQPDFFLMQLKFGF
jgi:hypothetical protein